MRLVQGRVDFLAAPVSSTFPRTVHGHTGVEVFAPCPGFPVGMSIRTGQAGACIEAVANGLSAHSVLDALASSTVQLPCFPEAASDR
jgi:hypothetical protein